MLLLLQYDVDVTGLHIRCLIPLLGKANLFAVAHTLINVDFDSLLRLDNTISAALTTSVLCCNTSTFPPASPTLDLHLLYHWAHLADDNLNTGTTTIGANS
mmetsp:Transcript_78171/g.137995  ORF Transcript_78171/g.137995 Transcript_78171/m.137995 type:complete len:101 (+) Transcript_78171:1354-1656(+)